MEHFTYLIIGGGPAGLQMGYFLQKHGASYVILERADKAGSFFTQYPRHRKLLSINKVYTGYTDIDSRLRYDWNSLLSDDESLVFSNYSQHYFPDADDLQRYLDDYACRWHLPIRYNMTVTNIAKLGDHFVLTTTTGQVYTCERLIVATGLFTPIIPQIEGVELCDTYADCSLDPADFVDQKIMIVGKGNSAFETAEHLHEVTRKIQICGPRYVKLAWTSHHVGDLRAVNNNFLDTYQLKGQNNILEGELQRVRQRADGQLVAEVHFASRQRSYDFLCDRIILCTGFRFDATLFHPSCRPILSHRDKLPALTSEWESVNVRDVYFIGTLMQSRDFKKTMSGFIHGFRHNIEAFHQMLQCKYEGQRWRRVDELPLEKSVIVNRILQRISTAPGLFLQPGFLCDVLVLPDDAGAPVLYYQDMPRDYVQDHWYGQQHHYYVITLEYGDLAGHHDPFALPRGMGVSEDFYLHPIVRRYEADTLVDRFYLPDDLDNDWRQDEHAQALQDYFAHQLVAYLS
ncbi:MAG: NAD(P)-binding domain-containing protein, partial [Candidatus Tectomicrobia bacterium]|nr:NAD(P)-binding domain-containing protein [Candidatus Tectomicrobia bacterium]